MALPAQYDGKSDAYRAWRDKRLQLADQSPDGKVPTIALAPELDSSSNCNALEELCKNVRDHGFGVYHYGGTENYPADEVEQLHRLLSLTVHDSGVVSDSGNLSLLKDLSGNSNTSSRGKFIPYTSKAMGWHTDGYYNDRAKTLRCFTLHCISPAATGGTLSMIDYELLLIALHDENPELIELLCHTKTMTLPANKDNLGHDRPDRHVPVFFGHTDGTLGARFTTRTKNIEWRTTETANAAQRAAEILQEHTHWHHRLRLRAGQGIITRNILHKREAFVDAPDAAPRQMLRGRYLQAPIMRQDSL